MSDPRYIGTLPEATLAARAADPSYGPVWCDACSHRQPSLIYKWSEDRCRAWSLGELDGQAHISPQNRVQRLARCATINADNRCPAYEAAGAFVRKDP